MIARSCVECGEKAVEPTAKPGRTTSVDGFVVELPEDFEIPTCVNCGAEMLDRETARRMDEFAIPVAISMKAEHVRRVVDDIRSTDSSIRLQDVERACGVTRSYLSHVQAGRKSASITLIRLLEAYAAAPAELHRHLRGEEWQARRWTKRNALDGRRNVSVDFRVTSIIVGAVSSKASIDVARLVVAETDSSSDEPSVPKPTTRYRGGFDDVPPSGRPCLAS